MNTTVREHVRRLKLRIDLLDHQIADEQCNQEQRNQIKKEIGIASLALAHYEAALKEEQKLHPLQEEQLRGFAKS